MLETRYRLTGQQRRGSWFAIAWMPVVVVATALLLSIRHFTWTAFLVLNAVTAALLVLVALPVFARFLGSTTLDDKGIHTRGVIRRHVRWGAVSSLDVASMGRGSGYALYAVLGKGRRQILLPGVVATRADAPEFLTAVEAIRAAWHEATQWSAPS